jgi:acyl-coenzyme A synthetase/AMP-(fatty) acid ligase
MERLVLIAETQLEDPVEREDLVLRLRTRLSTGLGLAAVVHLTGPHTLPQTSSGKIRRRQLRDQLATSFPQ